MALIVTDNRTRSRYELHDGDRFLGFTEYRVRDDGVLVFPHTVITEPKRGAGYGAALVQGALDDVRAQRATIVAECEFVQHFVAAHPEYQDLLA